jgi:hypothetical protein
MRRFAAISKAVGAMMIIVPLVGLAVVAAELLGGPKPPTRGTDTLFAVAVILSAVAVPVGLVLLLFG